MVGLILQEGDPISDIYFLLDLFCVRDGNSLDTGLSRLLRKRLSPHLKFCVSSHSIIKCFTLSFPFSHKTSFVSNSKLIRLLCLSLSVKILYCEIFMKFRKIVTKINNFYSNLTIIFSTIQYNNVNFSFLFL